MDRREQIYICRLGYLYLVDNIKKYTDADGNIDHRQAMLDFYDNATKRKYAIDYCEWMHMIHGFDKDFIKKIRRATKRSVYSKQLIMQ